MFSKSVNMPNNPRRPGPLADVALLAFHVTLYAAAVLVGLGVALGRRNAARRRLCDLKGSRN